MRYSDYQQSAASVGDASTARLALGVVAALTLFGGWLAFIGVCVASLSGMEMLSAMEVTRSEPEPAHQKQDDQRAGRRLGGNGPRASTS